MHVIAMAHSYLTGRKAGSEVMLHALLRSLAQKGHTVEAVITDSQDRGHPADLEGVHVRPLQRPDAMRYIQEHRPDVVVSQHKNLRYAFKAAREVKARTIQLLHSSDQEPMNKRDTLKPDLVVYNTDWLRKTYGRPKVHREMTVHPPVTPEEHRTKPGNAITLVNLNGNKGGHLFSELARRMPDHEFLGVSGAYGDQAIPETPPDNLTIAPTTSDMRADVWARTRVLLLPSRSESYGLVGVEAMCSGIPVIAHPQPGTYESLSYAGTFVDRDDVDGWVRSIELVKKNWAALSRISKSRSQDLSESDDLAVWVDSVENLTGRR